MDNKNGNSIPKPKDWKDQLADLDRQCGWDPAASLNWDEENNDDVGDDCRHPIEYENHVDRPTTPLREIIFLSSQNDNDSAIIDEDDEEYYSAVEYMDGEPSSPASSNKHKDYSGAHTMKMDLIDRAVAQEKLELELSPGFVAYVEHRFGPNIQYDDRCPCHEWLVDLREQRKRTERMYYAQYGTILPQDACVLREYTQADMHGTGDVDKPVLTVTTPDGETLYPHDEREWLQSSLIRAPSPIP